MPESFLKDKSVPARWRVLAVINGFILNGGCFYGSNAWMMEQLDCSEQTVSNAFEELESLGQVKIDRTRRTRKVYKEARDPSQLGSETQVGYVGDPSSFGTNSVSNSEKNTETKVSSSSLEDKSITTDEEYEIVSDTPERKKTERKDKGALALREKLYTLFEKELGARPTTHVADYLRILDAMKRLNEKQILELVEDGIDSGKKKTVREALTAREVDIYLQNN